MEAEPIPAELEWGEVLVNVRAAPISPADLYTVATGGLYGQDHSEPPFVGGHDGVGVIVKVCVGGRSAPQLPLTAPTLIYVDALVRAIQPRPPASPGGAGGQVAG